MYIPRPFEETRLDVLHALMRDAPLATLVTFDGSGLNANHLPLELDVSAGPNGTLRGHVSRANAVWSDTDPGVESLAIFQGPQRYVTPAWYPTKAETGKVVPTWNYVVVHAYGPIRFIDDAAWLRAQVERLTSLHEAGRERPWRLSDGPGDYIDAQLRGIVGLELPIARLSGKWKVSQNRTAADRQGVVDGLRAGGAAADTAMADLVERRD